MNQHSKFHKNNIFLGKINGMCCQVFFWLLFFFCTHGVLQAKTYLEFDGKKYYRAWEGTTGASNSIVEFLPKGQSLEHWDEMLSTRILSNLKDQDSYLRELETSIKQGNPLAKAVVYKEQHMIDFLVFSEA